MADLIVPMFDFLIREDKFVCIHIESGCELVVCSYRYGAVVVEDGISTIRNTDELVGLVRLFQSKFN